MRPNTGLESDAYRSRAGRENLILRVEPVETPTGDWGYRASYPELREVSATAPKVLEAILDLEAELSRHLQAHSA